MSTRPSGGGCPERVHFDDDALHGVEFAQDRVRPDIARQAQEIHIIEGGRAGYGDDAHAAIDFPQLPDDIAAVDSRHAHIGNDEIRLPAAPAILIEGEAFYPALGEHHFMALVGQHVAENVEIEPV